MLGVFSLLDISKAQGITSVVLNDLSKLNVLIQFNMLRVPHRLNLVDLLTLFIISRLPRSQSHLAITQEPRAASNFVTKLRIMRQVYWAWKIC